MQSHRWRSLVHAGSNYQTGAPRLSATFFLGFKTPPEGDPFAIRRRQEMQLAYLLREVVAGHAFGRVASARFHRIADGWRDGGKRAQ